MREICACQDWPDGCHCDVIEEDNETKHTPIPWYHIELTDSQVIYATEKPKDLYCERIAELPQWNYKGAGQNKDTAKGNAVFIVRACNAHDDLVNVVKAWVAMYEDKGEVPPEARIAAYMASIAALAKAK